MGAVMIARWIGLLAARLTTAARKDWAQAMQAEIDALDGGRERIGFALGCLVAALRLRLAEGESRTDAASSMPNGFAPVAITCGGIAAMIGLAYLSIADAPAKALIVNAGSLGIGLALVLACRATLPPGPAFAAVASMCAAFAILATALTGDAVEGATRWVRVGGLFVQTGLVLMPALVVAFARWTSGWMALTLAITAIALALQPDRAMTGALAAALVAVALQDISLRTAALAALASLSFAATLVQPDRLPAVPYVDHILWTAFDIHVVLGGALWAGCAALVVPAFLLGKRAPQAVAFGVIWGAIVAASAMGAYPTPIVGYGGGAILGYFLSIAALWPRVQPVGDADATRTRQKNTATPASEFQSNRSHFSVGSL